MSEATQEEIFGTDDRHEARVNSLMDSERIRREVHRRLKAEERGPVTLPRMCTLREQMANGTHATRWRIERWMPAGARVMLTAQFKAGKTTAVANLVRSVVDGEPWLGRDNVTQITGSVVIIDTEMTEPQLLEWLRAQDIRQNDRVIPIAMRGCLTTLDWRDPDLRSAWATTLKRVNADVLILDCLRPLLDAFGLDEHREAGQFLVAIDELLKDADIGECVVVHHMGHTGERARGDSRLRDWPDVEWRLMRRDANPASARFITAFGRDVDVPESAVLYEPETRHLSIVGGSRSDSHARDALPSVLDLLADSQTLGAREIERRLDGGPHGRDVVRAAIRLGIDEKRIIAERGSRGKILHRLRDRAALRGDCAAAQSSECAAT